MVTCETSEVIAHYVLQRHIKRKNLFCYKTTSKIQGFPQGSNMGIYFKQKPVSLQYEINLKRANQY